MKNDTIVDRVVLRLQQQPLGDLITEEDLHEIVKSAIPKVFFSPQKKESGDSWNKRTIETDPVIVEVMRELLRDNAQKLMKVWITENQELLVDHWRKVFDAGVMEYALKVQNEMLTGHIRDAFTTMVRTLNSERSAAGLPQLMSL